MSKFEHSAKLKKFISFEVKVGKKTFKSYDDLSDNDFQNFMENISI